MATKDVKSPYELARELRALAERLECAGTGKEVYAIQDALFERLIDLGFTAAELAAGQPVVFRV